MEPTWKTKTDPMQHPVRYTAKTWQSRMKESFGIANLEFTPKEYGQLKALMKHLGTLTPDVIDWALDETNWWHFSQRARAFHKLRFWPDRPQIGFLLQYRGHAMGLMNEK